MSSVSEQTEPIGGWLVVIAAILWTAPFSLFFVFLYDIQTFYAYHLQHDVITIIHLVDYSVELVISIIVLVLLMQRRAIFVKSYIAYRVYDIVLQTVLLIVSINIQRPLGPPAVTGAVIGYFASTVTILYLIRSKRVKQTFVR